MKLLFALILTLSSAFGVCCEASLQADPACAQVLVQTHEIAQNSDADCADEASHSDSSEAHNCPVSCQSCHGVNLGRIPVEVIKTVSVFSDPVSHYSFHYEWSFVSILKRPPKILA